MAETAPATAPLRTEQVSRLLHATAAQVLAECDGMRPSLAAWHPTGRDWCIKECVGHLIECEQRGFAGRIRQILEEPGRRLQTWDQVAVARARNDWDRDLGELIEEFVRLRDDSVRLVDSLLNADLIKSGDHKEVGSLSVEELLHEWVHHDRNHVRQIMANVQAYVWPSMGNARRFSELEAD